MFLLSIPSLIVSVVLAFFYLANVTIYWADQQEETKQEEVAKTSKFVSDDTTYWYSTDFSQTLSEHQKKAFENGYIQDNRSVRWQLFNASQPPPTRRMSVKVLKGISFHLFSRPPPFVA